MSRAVEERVCEFCSKEFAHRITRHRPGRFCSKDCMREAYRAKGEAERVACFWAKVNRTGACWLWTAARDGMGYGMFAHKRAHRFSWELHNGAIPEEMCVLHHCDTPACVRPDHLFLGTRDDNMRDRQAKGRQARGERAGRARLTAADVLEARRLRSEGRQIKVIAAELGVSASTIASACSRRSWRHV